MDITQTRQIIQSLGGYTNVARMLGITTPSVHAWLKCGIPEGRLIELAARLEVSTNGAFSRKKQWPQTYRVIWPELALSERNQSHE
jgi:DNA-binding transcriptional regulator YdaS (Cro superfamily)